MTINISGLRKLLGMTADGADPESAIAVEGDNAKTWILPISLLRHGREVKLILGDRRSQPPPTHSQTTQGLQRALKKALIWNDALLSGKKTSLAEIAHEEKVTQRYIALMIRLAYLAPDIQGAIIQGKIPPTWTVDQFRETMPLNWDQQRLRFRLRPNT